MVDTMPPEYDFSNAVRGKHHEAYRAGTNNVLLDPDVLKAFPDSAAVNEAQRRLLKLARVSVPSGVQPANAAETSSPPAARESPKPPAPPAAEVYGPPECEAQRGRQRLPSLVKEGWRASARVVGCERIVK
jgi:hypothetical protein